MKQIVDMGLHKRAYIIAGVMPLKSAGMATYLNEKVPGVIVPQQYIDRIKGVPKEDAANEGIDICCEIIDEIRSIEGIHGIHIMAIEWEHRVGEIVEKAGLKKNQPIQA